MAQVGAAEVTDVRVIVALLATLVTGSITLVKKIYAVGSW
jgi:hypothetical protein